MRIFVTGATGFIGSTIVGGLLAHGYQVLGMTRSEEGAAKLRAMGAEIHHGSLEDKDSLKRGAEQADGVIHTAFNHDFSKYVANCEDDRQVIEALGSVLIGSDRPLLVTSGTGMANTPDGGIAVEDAKPANAQNVPRAASEEAATALLDKGVNVSVVRLAQIHNTARQGLITPAIMLAREKGVSAYIGDGTNRWCAAHVCDTARLYILALQKTAKGAFYHAVAEEGVPMRTIAETIANRLSLPAVSISPEEADAHFGWMAAFARLDLTASSTITRNLLGWEPVGPGLISDLEHLDLDALG